jgi:hypothetical protein
MFNRVDPYYSPLSFALIILSVIGLDETRYGAEDYV